MVNLLKSKKLSGSGIKYIALTVILLFTNLCHLYADDPGTPGCGDGTDPDVPPCDLPLDNWVYMLVIAAVIYGAYKLAQKNKALAA